MVALKKKLRRKYKPKYMVCFSCRDKCEDSLEHWADVLALSDGTGIKVFSTPKEAIKFVGSYVGPNSGIGGYFVMPIYGQIYSNKKEIYEG